MARNNSAYFKATEAQTWDMAQFFLKTTGGHYLKDAPGGDKYLTKDKALLTRGKVVFAETCARCHSSKAPSPAAGLDPPVSRRGHARVFLTKDQRPVGESAEDRRRLVGRAVVHHDHLGISPPLL